MRRLEAMRRLGSVQMEVLRSLIEHGHWSTRTSWSTRHASAMARILAALHRRHLVRWARPERGGFGTYRITRRGRMAVKRPEEKLDARLTEAGRAAVA